MEIIKVIILGIIEGITEWLPISSTGHMILFDEFIKLSFSAEFKEMFFVVIQLGAVAAVAVIFFKRLWPFKESKSESKKTWNLLFKIVVGCLPLAIVGFLFDDFIDKYFYNYIVVALMLIIYGIIFIVVENKCKDKSFKVTDINKMSYKTAFMIGLFQVLSIIPGTSRSGATIIGGMLLGTSRTVAAEYTFFLALPVMLGASLLKIIKFGFVFSSIEIICLIVGVITAFVVSLLIIKFLINYIKKHDFKVFGYYRIFLGLIVLLYFLIF
ncbi:MAG: undecaprenyl-diphosphate phosphatase [Bacilli bacterium]